MSWAVQWYASRIFYKICIHYIQSIHYVKNINGVDGSGKNTVLKYEVNSNFIKKYKVHKIKKISENIFARKQFEKYFERQKKIY